MTEARRGGVPAAPVVDRLLAGGVDFFTGVPCSLVGGVIAELERRGLYFGELREDSALGVAAGAYLAGKLPLVVMQNSGVGVSLNALGSLHLLYEMPCLLLVTWRGYDGKDAPEHLVMGEAMPALFDSFGVPHERVALAGFDEQAKRLAKKLEETRQPVALVVAKGELV